MTGLQLPLIRNIIPQLYDTYYTFQGLISIVLELKGTECIAGISRI